MPNTSNFTPRCQQVIALARKEAHRLNHSSLLSEHLLLGLMMLGQGVAVDALKSLTLDAEKLRAEIEKNLPPGTEPLPISTPSYSPDVKKVFVSAQREALRLHHVYVGTEHLLLGILAREESSAVALLKKMGIETHSIRFKVLSELDPKFDKKLKKPETAKALSIKILKSPILTTFLLLQMDDVGLSEKGKQALCNAKTVLLEEFDFEISKEAAQELIDMLFFDVIPESTSVELVKAAVTALRKILPHHEAKISMQAELDCTVEGTQEEKNWALALEYYAGVPAVRSQPPQPQPV